MTIKNLITFLENSAKNCKDGVNTPIRHIRINDGWHESVVNVNRSSFILDKRVSATLGDREYVNLVIEED